MYINYIKSRMKINDHVIIKCTMNFDHIYNYDYSHTAWFMSIKHQTTCLLISEAATLNIMHACTYIMQNNRDFQ